MKITQGVEYSDVVKRYTPEKEIKMERVTITDKTLPQREKKTQTHIPPPLATTMQEVNTEKIHLKKTAKKTAQHMVTDIGGSINGGDSITGGLP